MGRSCAAVAVVVSVFLGGLIVTASPAAAQGLPPLPPPDECGYGSGTFSTYASAFPLDLESSNGNNIGDFVRRRAIYADQECVAGATQLATFGGIDCRVTASSLPSDGASQLTALGGLIDFLFSSVLTPGGSWWEQHKSGSAVPLITTHRNKTLYFIGNCDLHPVFDRFGAQVKIQNISMQFGAGFGAAECQLDNPEGDWAYSHQDNWFPELSGGAFKFGCPYYVPSGGADNFADDLGDAELCSVSFRTSTLNDDSILFNHTMANTATDTGCSDPDRTSPVGSEPGQCCTFPNFGPDDPPAPWSTRLNGCQGITVTSDDNSDVYFQEGDDVEFTLSAVDPSRPPRPSAFPVQVRLNSGIPTVNGTPGYQSTSRSSLGPFTMTVPPDGSRLNLDPEEPRLLDYITFDLVCADGTRQLVFYDPSGSGGPRDVSPGTSADLSDCLASASTLGLDPDSWVPGLVDRMKCLVEWTVTPEHPMGYHLAAWRNTAEGSTTGELVGLVQAPYQAMRTMATNSTTSNTINLPTKADITLPALPPETVSKTRLALQVVFILTGFWRIAVLLGRALGMTVHTKSDDGD